MNTGRVRRSIFSSAGAILAGWLLIIVLAVIVDSSLQYVGVLPVTGQQKFADWQSGLALTYHLIFVAAGGYVAARLAPVRPIGHAVALGVIGLLMSIAGQIAIIEGDLAPRWYGWALIILAVPTAGFGGWLYAFGANCIANDRTGNVQTLSATDRFLASVNVCNGNALQYPEVGVCHHYNGAR